MQKFFLLLFTLLICHKIDAIPFPINDANPLHEAFVLPIREASPPVALVSEIPPPQVKESIPPRPVNDAEWIPGYWAWSETKTDFIWICGVWRRPPPNHQWIPGNWLEYQGGWAWQSGFWSKLPYEQLDFIIKAPPKSIDDVVPPAPASSFWVRGYWDYNQNTYTWLSGKWEPINFDWVMTPAHYIWRIEGYVFVPMYWDFQLEARGNAYSCERAGEAPLVIIEPMMVINQLFCWYPNYSDLVCHWNFVHPGWWDDCGCAPPWWFWNNWWAFAWDDMWGLWWWWCHPGAFPPFWLPYEYSEMISPPPQVLVIIMDKIKKPHFDVKLGKDNFLPKGPKNGDELKKPQIPTGVKPGGQVTMPPSPQGSSQNGNKVHTPPPPLKPHYEPLVDNPPAYNPPTYIPPQTYMPPRDYYPDYTPPRDRRPPDYIPPNDRRPPDYIPPRDRYPDYPPQEKYPKWPTNPRKPENKKPDYVPPSKGHDRTPTYPGTWDKNPNYVPPSRDNGRTQGRPERNYPQLMPKRD